jgi:hypothetical protein
LLLGPIATFLIVVLPAAGPAGAAPQPVGLTRVLIVAGAAVITIGLFAALGLAAGGR